MIDYALQLFNAYSITYETISAVMLLLTKGRGDINFMYGALKYCLENEILSLIFKYSENPPQKKTKENIRCKPFKNRWNE